MLRGFTARGLALASLAALLTAGPAAADPVPGEDDVRRAQQQESSTAAEAGRIQAELAAARARAEDAETALSVAAEDYDEARIELEASRRAAARAQDAAARAQGKLAEARSDVGRLAAQAYRDGGGVAQLEAVLSPAGPQEVLDRAASMRLLGDRRRRTVQRMDATRVVATVMARQAGDAVARNRLAEARLAQARQAAERQAASARSGAAAAAAEEAAIVARLAAARRTTVALETARQQGLREQAERQAERQPAQPPARRPVQQRPSRRTDPPVAAQQEPEDPPSGNAGQGSSPVGGSSNGSSSGGQAAVAWARRQVGLPYLWGGDGPDSYDCSGLTMRAWERAGVALPHSSRLQYRTSQKVSYDALRPGDLIFYATDTTDPATIHHVTLYAGGGMMVEAPATGLDVRVVPVRRARSMPYAGRP